MTPSPRVLATRCPHCHTVFRVVADQLKLRDGLVRCGHCREVFDGRAYLCEPPTDDGEPHVAADTGLATDGITATDRSATADAAPAPAQAHETHAADIASSSAVPSVPALFSDAPAHPSHTAHSSPPSHLSDADATTSRAPVPEMLTPTAIAALLGTADESRAQMQHGPGRYIDDDDATVLPAPTATPVSTTRTGTPATASNGKQPGAARIVWRVLMVFAIVGLVAQWAWLERAALVDRFPVLRPAFAAIGRPLHIAVAPPRQPEMLQLSSVTLVTDNGASASADTAAQAAPASDATAASAASADSVPMTLTVFMRNDAGHAVAWPSLELTLSDIDGKPVVRRVFAAADYVAEGPLRDAGLAPHNERTIRLRLSAQAALASNYRVLAFYP